TCYTFGRHPRTWSGDPRLVRSPPQSRGCPDQVHGCPVPLFGLCVQAPATLSVVIPGLGPGIHAFYGARHKAVDARTKSTAVRFRCLGCAYKHLLHFRSSSPDLVRGSTPSTEPATKPWMPGPSPRLSGSAVWVVRTSTCYTFGRHPRTWSGDPRLLRSPPQSRGCPDQVHGCPVP